MRKRLFDIIASLVGLVLLMPFFLLIALFIKLDSDGGVFFRQVRVGRFGMPFKIHKFRTMYIEAESKGRLTVGDDARITKPGKLLRKYKLDELPQLIDVLLGDMSFVGPRPEVKQFMDAYPADIQEKVLSVRPGITDLASIEMVDENRLLAEYNNPTRAYIDVILPIKQRHYMNYVESQSFWLDLKIIFLTIYKILGR